MPRKLFVTSWHRQSDKAISLLQDANIQVTIVNVDDIFHGRGLLEGLTGSHKIPILFVDGVKYEGVGEIRDGYLSS
jgi:hypothetical protein